MLKALLKKQFLQLNVGYYQNPKSGKRRGTVGTILYVALFAFIFIFLGAVFYMVAGVLCGALIPPGLTWLYFAIMGVLSVALGVFGSVFNTYAALYHAKDNEMLLSMPIPPRMILFTRLIGVFAMSLLYECAVLIPAILAYFAQGDPSALSAVNCVLLIFVIGLFVLVLTCALGWVVALISAKLKNKSFITVILSVAFLGAYYWCSANFSNAVNHIAANGMKIAEGMKQSAYPLYLLGRAAEGHAPSMLLFTAIVAALFAVTWFVMEKTFMRIATASGSAAKKAYREKPMKLRGMSAALFRREWKRYAASPTYILNCSLGTLMMTAAAVAALIFRRKPEVYLALTSLGGDFVPAAVTAAICMFTTMNDITAPSISLEGKNIWILQSMPVPAVQVFAAKQRLHWALTMPPAVLLCASLAFVLKFDFTTAALMTVIVLVFIMLSSAGGLVLNLLRPNLSWTNETAPIKQSLNVAVALFGGWLLCIGMGAAAWFALKRVSFESFQTVWLLTLAFASNLLNRWLNTKGAKIFERL